MKLILKDKQEIIVDHMNNIHAFEKLKNRQGNTIDTENSISFLIFNSSTDFEEVKSKLEGGNTTDFKLSYGDGEEKTFPGRQVKSITEEISDDRHVITIALTD